MAVVIQYVTRRGAHISKQFPSMADGGGAELERLYARRVKAIAYAIEADGQRGEKVGEVYDDQVQDNPRAKWAYFYERDA